MFRRFFVVLLAVTAAVTAFAQGWALTRLSVASHRSEAKHSAELSTQSLMGTPLRIIDTKGNWLRVESPEGYQSYVPASAVVRRSEQQMDRWRASARMIVTSPFPLLAFKSPTDSSPRQVVTDLVPGCIVALPGGKHLVENGRLHISLPDGRSAWADAAAFKPLEQWATQNFDANVILDQAFALMGVPYLWGGTSPKGIDCSGLTKMCYFANGIILQRDAWQQALTGKRIEADAWRNCQAGDLLFFGSGSDRVTHVGIYDRDGLMIHSSGRVILNSLDPKSANYVGRELLHAVRIAGSEDSPGITSARYHPWYFNTTNK